MTRTLLFLLAATPVLCQQAPAKPILPSAQPASTAARPGMPEPVPGSCSLIVVPDTQFYAQLYPETFHQQTQWIADNAKTYDIRFVIQVGDVTETAADAEWRVAQAAFARLNGVVPWSSAPGNHDYGGKLQIQTRRTPFSLWFPVDTFKSMPTFGGVYAAQPDKTENHYHTFEAAGRKWLVVALEFAPRGDVLRWADEVVAAHPDHAAILFTHAYLDPKTNQRINLSSSIGNVGSEPGRPPPDINHGEDIWQKVASKHANVAMVISGHACYTNHRNSPGAHGNSVHEMVVDYQKDENGGNGWMRMLQLMPDGKTVHCVDFSPKLDLTCTMPDRTYDFEIGAVAGRR